MKVRCTQEHLPSTKRLKFNRGLLQHFLSALQGGFCLFHLKQMEDDWQRRIGVSNLPEMRI